MKKRVVGKEAVEKAKAEGRRAVHAPAGESVVTPGAWERARELDVAIDTGAKESAAPRTLHTVDAGSADRIVDASGLVVVRGRSVKLGEFQGAGPGKHVGLTDVVTARDGSPMTAGLMSWGRDDSFPWSLDYDEIDLVLEGVLRIEIAGRAHEGRAGDVFYIPKGSRIVFGTPSRVKVFYVTYPADWAAAASAPPRPQK